MYNALKNHDASDCYLSHDGFRIPYVEYVMSEVFGSEHAGDEAVSWTCY